MGEPSRVQKTKLALATAMAGLALIAPALWSHSGEAMVWAAVLLVPHTIVLFRTLREPTDRSGPAMAFGVVFVMLLAAVLLFALQFKRREWLPFAYAGGLAATHLLTGALAVKSYREGHAAKPHWRYLLRGIVEPVLYFAFLLIVEAGSAMHLD